MLSSESSIEVLDSTLEPPRLVMYSPTQGRRIDYYNFEHYSIWNAFLREGSELNFTSPLYVHSLSSICRSVDLSNGRSARL